MPSQPVHGPSAVERHDDLVIPIGRETMAASRYEPVDVDEPVPVILVAYPYRKDDRIVFGSQDESLRYLARNGYETVVVDLLGTGASSGAKERGFGHEGEALCTAIEWLGDREWSSGQVGMYGLSWGGLTQLQAASVQPEALGAIVPVAISSSPFEVFYPGGVFDTLRWPTWATGMVASQALPPSRRDPDGRWADAWHEHLDGLRDLPPWLFDWLDHHRFDDFWADHEIDVGAISVPTFLAVGYRDIHVPSVVSYFEEIGATKRLLLGPFRHRYPHLGREAAVDFRRQAVEWYDHHLKGADNGAPSHAPVEFWTERDGGWTPGAGVWRARDDWPTMDSVDDAGMVSYALAPDGLVPEADFAEGAVEREYEPDATVGVHSMQRIAGLETEGVDTSPDDDRSATFETGPLDRPVELTGTGRATIRLRPSTPDPVVVVRVNDVLPDGTAKPVTYGYRAASYRGPRSDPQPLAPGEAHDLAIPLFPRSHVFEAGHRIRLAVSAALFPRAMAAAGQGPFTVLSSPDAPSTLTHPGVIHDGEPTFDDGIEMAAPDDGVVPTQSKHVVDSGGRWRVERSRPSDAVTLEAASESTVRLPHGADLTTETTITAVTPPDDPSAGYVRNDAVFVLEYDAERFVAEATSRLAHDYAVLSTSLAVDDQPIFEQTWRR